MDSVYAPKFRHAGRPSPVVGTADDSRDQLEGVSRLSRKWVERYPVGHPQREMLMRMGTLAEGLLTAGNYSPVAMTRVRDLMCGNCRRLDAAQGRCHGQSLDRCLLLKEPDSQT